jgi:hypothetical protein
MTQERQLGRQVEGQDSGSTEGGAHGGAENGFGGNSKLGRYGGRSEAGVGALGS